MADGYMMILLLILVVVLTKQEPCSCPAPPMAVSNAEQQHFEPGSVVSGVGRIMQQGGEYAHPPACVALPQGMCGGNCVWCHRTRLCKSRLF